MVRIFLFNFAVGKRARTKNMSMALEKKEQEKRPYRLGVALSGGGARGFAHAGALIAIEEAGLKPDVVAGVSAGSVVAVLYAAGIKPIDMADVFRNQGFRDLTELTWGKGGLLKIDRFTDLILEAIAPKKNIEDLELPTLICASDLDNARPHIFTGGAIGPRMKASCSIPIIFPPVEIDGIHYVDGGVLRNMPAWALRDKCDMLIGVNVSPLRRKSDYKSMFEIAYRTYGLMAKANQAQDMALCDVAIQMSEIADYAVFDLGHIKELVIAGYKKTRQALIDAGLWADGKSKLLNISTSQPKVEPAKL